MSDVLVPLNATAPAGSTGWSIATVHPGSPAFGAGITRDWRLIAIGGTSPDPDRLFQARAADSPFLTFADEAGRLWEWKGRIFPFGLHLAPPVDRVFRKAVQNGRADRQFLVERFAIGDLDVFVDLIDDFKRALGGANGLLARLGLGSAKLTATVPVSDDYEFLGFLGLGYAAARQFSDAMAACEAATKARERVAQASYSGNTHAIHHMTQLLVAEAQGRPEDAVAHIEAAIDLKPEHPFLRETYKRLLGYSPAPHENIPPGTVFPITYALPNRDPLGELKTHGQVLSLQSALAAMEPKQVVIILALGGYRSNYYANLDIERLALAARACPGRIADVQIISSSDYALDANHRQFAEGLARKFGLPLTILWDEDDSVMSRLSSAMSPARFCLDSAGTVLSTSPFEEEAGLWQALNELDMRA